MLCVCARRLKTVNTDDDDDNEYDFYEENFRVTSMPLIARIIKFTHHRCDDCNHNHDISRGAKMTIVTIKIRSIIMIINDDRGTDAKMNDDEDEEHLNDN